MKSYKTLLLSSIIVISLQSKAQIEDSIDTTAAPAFEYEYEDAEAPLVDYKIYPITDKKITDITTNPDKQASYPGGIGVMMDMIQSNLVKPYSYGQSAKFVYLKVVVGKDSMLYNAEALSTPGTEYTEAAISALEYFEKKFIPASSKGKPVNSTIIIPIRFEGYTEQYYH